MSELDVASADEAIIAPMLTTEWLQFMEYPEVFVKTAAGFVRVTWKRDGFWTYVVQATMTADGDVTFSYDAEAAPYAAALAIKDGAFTRAEMVLGEVFDSAGDAHDPMLDIMSATMSRVGNSNLVRFRIETAAPVSTAGLADDEWVSWSAAVTDPTLPTGPSAETSSSIRSSAPWVRARPPIPIRRGTTPPRRRAAGR